MPHHRALLSGLYLAVVLSVCSRVPLQAQGAPFAIRVQQPDFVTIVANGANLTVNAPQGAAEVLTVNLIYSGSGLARFVSDPVLTGSTAFQITSSSAVPVTLANGQFFSYTIRYLPRTSAAVSAQVTIPFSETVTTGPLTQVTTQGLLSLQFTGTTPEFVVSYIPADPQNYISLAPGGNIQFPPTPVNSTSNLILSIVNRGSGAGEVRSVLLNGDSFQTVGLTLLPFSLNPGAEARVGLRFQPTSPGEKTGTLSILFAGVTQVFNLAGSAFTTQFAYEFLTADGIRPLTPGGTIDLGESLPGETLSGQLLIRNVNPIATLIPPISVFGGGFGLAEVPVNRTLRPGETVGFFIQSQLTQIGAARGRLRIGDDAFELLATATGAQLRFNYSSSGSPPVVLTPGNSIFFRATTIGSSEEAVVTLRNSGLTSAPVISIALPDGNPAFSLRDLPTLPVTLEPNQDLSFRVRFSPSVSGSIVSILRVDNFQFGLVGSSTALPSLPPYRFLNSQLAPYTSGTIGALSQSSIGLELNETYPVALNGTLILSQEAIGFVGDPSVRFVNGATTAAFTIPANSRRAIFSNGSPLVRFQTGSVAGSIFFRANFAAGNVSVADTTASVLELTIPPAPPRILSGLVVPGNNALLITLTALAVTRSATKLDFEITPEPGFNFARTSFSLDLVGQSLGWFRSEASQASGGIFTIQVPLNLAISGNTTGAVESNLIQSIRSIAFSLTNESGTSDRLVLNLR